MRTPTLYEVRRWRRSLPTRILVRFGLDRWALNYVRGGLAAGWITPGVEEVKVTSLNRHGQVCTTGTSGVVSVTFTDTLPRETFEPFDVRTVRRGTSVPYPV